MNTTSNSIALRLINLDTCDLVFTDRSQECYSKLNTIEQFPDPIPLPNRHLISICSGIGEILHNSGAGPFVEKLLQPCKQDLFTMTVHSWQELEELVRLKMSFNYC